MCGTPSSRSSTSISSVRSLSLSLPPAFAPQLNQPHVRVHTDTTGTLYSMAKFAGLRDPETLDFENSNIAYCIDAFCISMGALMGISPVTAYIESATGISGAYPQSQSPSVCVLRCR